MRRAEAPLLPCLVLLMSLLLTAPLTSQVASYVRIADGCPGSQGVPSLSAVADSLPILGEAFSAELTNVPSNGMAVGIIGLSTTNWGAFSLPLDLTSAGLPNCFLHIDLRWTTGLVIAGGTATWDVTIPSSTEWIGRSFFQQVVVLDPGVGAVMSDAVEAVIGWTPPDIFLESTIPGQTFAWKPEIASSGDSVYVIWEDGRSGIGRDVRFNRSLDGGATWMTSNIQLNTEAHAAIDSFYPPRIAASGDSVYVAWRDQRDGQVGNIYFNRSLDRGTTWLTSDIRLDTDIGVPQVSGGLRIAALGESVYVAWSDGRHDRTAFGTGLEIYFNRSLDGGLTWLSSDIRLTTKPLLGIFQSLVADIKTFGDQVYVIWQDRRHGSGSTADVYFNRSLDRGATWLSSDVRLDADQTVGAFAGGAQLRVSGGTLVATWADKRDGNWDIYFNRSLDGGVTWLSSDIRLSTDLPGVSWALHPQIAVSGNSVYVAWDDWRDSVLTSGIYLNRSLDGGVTWLSSDIQLDTNLPIAVRWPYRPNPQIIASGESVFVTWSTASHIHLNRSLDGGATWLISNIRLSTDLPGTALSEFPQIAASGDFAYVTWADRRDHIFPGWYDIYFNRVPIR